MRARAGPFPSVCSVDRKSKRDRARDTDEILKMQCQLISAVRNSMVMERARLSLPVMRYVLVLFRIYYLSGAIVFAERIFWRIFCMDFLLR